MKTTQIGQAAETAAANFLLNEGYKILFKNWRTRVCEIDVIALKDNIVYFVEVKYRHKDNQGDGFSYITGKKLRQMNFAAQIWNQQNNWDGDYRLLGVAVDSADYRILDIVEID
jgi:uncharacterized protein (TIGR00252 family)